MQNTRVFEKFWQDQWLKFKSIKVFQTFTHVTKKKDIFRLSLMTQDHNVLICMNFVLRQKVINIQIFLISRVIFHSGIIEKRKTDGNYDIRCSA